MCRDISEFPSAPPRGAGAVGFTTPAAEHSTDHASTLVGLSRDPESDMISLNHHGLGLPETPFGGVKELRYELGGGGSARKASTAPQKSPRVHVRAVAHAEHERFAFKRDCHFTAEHMHEFLARVRGSFAWSLAGRQAHENRLELAVARPNRQACEQIGGIGEGEVPQIPN